MKEITVKEDAGVCIQSFVLIFVRNWVQHHAASMKNRTMLGLLCIIVAVTLMFGVAPIVGKVAANKVEIVQVIKDMKEGQKITAEDIRIIQAGGYNLPDSVIKDKNAVIGKYAAYDLKADEYLLKTKITANSTQADSVLKTLNGSEQAISITISSFAGGLSGKLQNGDIVSILVTKDNTTVIPPELTYVKVITSTTSKGTDQDKLTEKEDGTTDIPSTVTLLVSREQAILLAGYESGAKIHLSLAYRGDSETADQFLAAQKSVLDAKGVSGK